MSDAADQTVAEVQRLGPRERARLAGILARLASPFEGERAAAGLLASAFVAKHELTWSHLTNLLQPLPDAAGLPAKLLSNRRRAGEGVCRGYGQTRPSPHGRALDLFT
jgi:hypothetical protein